MTVDEALSLWQAKKASIVDVRTLEEYKAIHIPGVALIPLEELGERRGEIDKKQTVLLICRSGNRSEQGTNLLRSLGYDKVDNIEGGMLKWNGPVNKE